MIGSSVPAAFCDRWFTALTVDDAAQIAEALPDSNHEYREWIQTYASEDYLELPAKHEHLIDTLGPAQPYGAQRTGLRGIS
jgi:thiaminase